MRFADRCPIVVTPHKGACREFWVRRLDFRFGFADPSGLWVDVVQQIEPARGWWEPCMRPTSHERAA
jgi:hypothetical protein